MPEPSPWIVETTQATFEQDVFERSRDVPVVLDFRAAWCQPCRLLGPLLEKLAQEHAGGFVLVKADVDQVPQWAQSLAVEAVPTVLAIRGREVVDQFVGVLPEPQLRAWIEAILPSGAEVLAQEAKELAMVDPAAAEAKYREAIGLMPNEAWVRVELARVLLGQDRLDEARQTLDDVAALGALDAEGERLQAEINLRIQAREGGGLEQARAAAEANPRDPNLQLQLANALAAAGRHAEAMDVCLRLIQTDRAGTGQRARELMVELFHLLGPDSELAGTYRRKLTMLLY